MSNEFTDDDPDDTESDEGLHLAGKKPTGRVVGIIKRNWKPYHYIVGILF